MRAQLQSSVFEFAPSSSQYSAAEPCTEKTSLDIGDSSPSKTRYKVLGKRLQPQDVDWRQPSTEVRPSTGRPYNPQEFKAKQLRSSLDLHSFPSKSAQTSPKNTDIVYQIDPKSLKQYNLTRVEHTALSPEASVVTLEVSGLKGGCTDDYLKSLCRGFHMVSVSTDVNRITGKCTGKAVVQARVPDVATAKQLNAKLADMGYQVKAAEPKLGRQLNFFDCKGTTFLDPSTEIAQRKLISKQSRTNQKEETPHHKPSAPSSSFKEARTGQSQRPASARQC